jgi:flavin-dependent dehydrogenase
VGAADTMASEAERATARVRAGQLADLIQRVEEVEVGPADSERGDFGTEHLLVMQLVFADRPEGRARRELENLARGVDPEVIGDALRGLQAAGVVILDGERVRPSRCALRLDALGVICL